MSWIASACGTVAPPPPSVPASNLFMGSGLYDLMAAAFSGHRVGIGSDVGGGTDYSLLRTLGEAYKVQQLLGHSLHPSYALYLATLGSAKALYLDDRLGKLQPGYAADAGRTQSRCHSASGQTHQARSRRYRVHGHSATFSPT